MHGEISLLPLYFMRSQGKSGNPIATSQGECRDCLLGMEEDRQEWAAYEYQQQHRLA
jgi:hypothetical protein